jgi:hypothetical protein
MKTRRVDESTQCYLQIHRVDLDNIRGLRDLFLEFVPGPVVSHPL